MHKIRSWGVMGNQRIGSIPSCLRHWFNSLLFLRWHRWVCVVLRWCLDAFFRSFVVVVVVAVLILYSRSPVLACWHLLRKGAKSEVFRLARGDEFSSPITIDVDTIYIPYKYIYAFFLLVHRKQDKYNINVLKTLPEQRLL